MGGPWNATDHSYLWFDDQAEEAAKFYVPVFKNSKIGNMSHYGEAGAKVSGGPKGCVTLDRGVGIHALNGGLYLTFPETDVQNVRPARGCDVDIFTIAR